MCRAVQARNAAWSRGEAYAGRTSSYGISAKGEVEKDTGTLEALQGLWIVVKLRKKFLIVTAGSSGVCSRAAN